MNRIRFIKDFSTLAGSSVIAQVIILGSTPVLGRLYTPEDFGFLAVITALTALVSPLLCGRFEVAGVLPNSKVMAGAVFSLAVLIAVVFSLVACVLVLFCEEPFAALLRIPEWSRWLLLAPVFFFIRGLQLVGEYSANRAGEYRRMGVSNVLRAASQFLAAVLLAMVMGGIPGLVIASLFSNTVAALPYWGKYIAPAFARLIAHPKRCWVAARHYWEFPAFNASSGMINTVSGNLPTLVLTSAFGTAVAGGYGMANRTVATPLNTFGMAISRLTLKYVADMVKRGQSVHRYVFKMMGLQLILVVPVVVIMMMWGSEIFRIWFGERWGEAGLFVEILAPALGLRFIASGVSSVYSATNNTHLAFIRRIVALLCHVAAIAYFLPQGDPIILLKGLTCSFLVQDTVALGLITLAACRPRAPRQGGRRAAKIRI